MPAQAHGASCRRKPASSQRSWIPAYAGMTIAQLAGLSDDRSRVATGDSGSQAPLYTPWHTRARDAGLPLDLHCR